MSKSPLFPDLPYSMQDRAATASRDIRLKTMVGGPVGLKYQQREDACTKAFGERYAPVREHSGALKQHVLDHLDHYLGAFTDAAERNGMHVHFAADAAQANAICVAIAEEMGAKLCVKSKSMVTEETHLLPELEAAGVETIETDLGEFIVQLDRDAPSHIVAPIIHKDRRDVGRAFERELGVPYQEDPEQLTIIARDYLRTKYRKADLGISGANFLVADTGSVVVCTNEGNADLAMLAPRVHIVMTGIEKLVAKADHLGAHLKLLARSGTAQDLTVYTSFIHGPRRAGECDGPEAVHVILLDNGRSGVLAEDSRELLRCIRCGACLNACPVYRNVGGGHAYGSVYSGPIGAILTPHLKGLDNYPDLPKASSLCGSCHHVCPVNIDIPHHLVRLRRQAAERGITPARERLLLRLWAWSLRSPARYRLGQAMTRAMLRRLASARNLDDGIADQGWVSRLRAPLSAWTDERDLPTPTSRSFRDWWREEGRP